MNFNNIEVGMKLETSEEIFVQDSNKVIYKKGLTVEVLDKEPKYEQILVVCSGDERWVYANQLKEVGMSELISGKEALIALANEKEVETKRKDEITWSSIGFFAVNVFKDDNWEFRLKPRTITLNNIEVPAPFEPKLGERYYVLQPCNESGWMGEDCVDMEFENTWSQFGAWRTEDEIKQVVAALKKIFVINNQ